MLIRILTVGAVGLLVGCATQSSPTPAWNPSMSHVFSNDDVRPDETPREYWTAEDEELLLRRMGFADTVVLGTLRVLTQYNRGGVATQLTLAFKPDEVLFGKVATDEDDEISLQPDPESQEFRSALRLQRSLPGTRYLLFLKQRPGVGPRWAVYYPSARLLDEVRSRYAWLRQHQQASHKM